MCDFLSLLTILQTMLENRGDAEWRDETEFSDELALMLSNQAEVEKLWIADEFETESCSLVNQHRSSDTGIYYDIALSESADEQVPEQFVQNKLAGYSDPSWHFD